MAFSLILVHSPLWPGTATEEGSLCAHVELWSFILPGIEKPFITNHYVCLLQHIYGWSAQLIQAPIFLSPSSEFRLEKWWALLKNVARWTTNHRYLRQKKKKKNQQNITFNPSLKKKWKNLDLFFLFSLSYWRSSSTGWKGNSFLCCQGKRPSVQRQNTFEYSLNDIASFILL